MNNIAHIFEKIEDKWFEKLYSACKHIFSKTNIPSHDHDHHKRVWEICKEILTELNKLKPLEEELIEACIIASFFHDTGLSFTLDENHGMESRILCEVFFNENSIDKPLFFYQILDAIEKHDDKEYKNLNSDPYSLLSILCAADDLDAFGNIGVVRYTEIYLLRGIGLRQLPELVIKNLDNRFLNFENTFKEFQTLFLKHKQRYFTTRNFFEQLTNEFK